MYINETKTTHKQQIEFVKIEFFFLLLLFSLLLRWRLLWWWRLIDIALLHFFYFNLAHILISFFFLVNSNNSYAQIHTFTPNMHVYKQLITEFSLHSFSFHILSRFCYLNCTVYACVVGTVSVCVSVCICDFAFEL